MDNKQTVFALQTLHHMETSLQNMEESLKRIAWLHQRMAQINGESKGIPHLKVPWEAGDGEIIDVEEIDSEPGTKDSQ